MSRAVDGNSSPGLAASGSAFTLRGGTYLLTAHINSASGLTGGLQIVSADGANYVPCSPTYAHVSGYQVLYLPDGSYKWVVSGTPGTGETFDLAVWQVPGGVTMIRSLPKPIQRLAAAPCRRRGGTVTLQDSGGNTYATFTAAGNMTDDPFETTCRASEVTRRRDLWHARVAFVQAINAADQAHSDRVMLAALKHLDSECRDAGTIYSKPADVLAMKGI